MGYLGKISAVVSVNTGDFATKINQAKNVVDQFSASMQRSLQTASRSASSSFGSIYTEVQKLERALQAASKLEFTGLKGFDGKGLKEASDQMQQIHEVASQLSAPLAKAVASVDAMSHAIKANLHNAMVEAQADVENLQTKVKLVGTVTANEFGKAEAKVRSFAAAAKFASEAAQGASAITGGSGMKFQKPLLNREFERGAELQGKVGSFPVLRVTEDVSSLLNKQKQLADEAANMAAAYAAMPTDRTAADLQSSVTAFQSVNDEINLLIVGYEKLDKTYADDKAAALAAAAAKIAAAKKVSEALLGLQQNRTFSATGEAQNIQQLTSAYDQLLARLRALPDADRAKVAAATQPAMSSVEDAISSGEQANVLAGAQALAQAKADILDSEKSVLAAKEATAAADKQAAQDAAKAKSSAEALLRLEQSRLQVMTGEAQSVSQVSSQYAGLLSRVEKLSASQKAMVNPTIDANAGKVEDVISGGDDSKVAGIKAEIVAIEQQIVAAEALDAAEKKAKKSGEALLGLQQSYSQSLTGQAQNVAQLKSNYDGLISRFEKLSLAERSKLQAAGFGVSADKVRQTIADDDDSKVAAAGTALVSMEAEITASEKLVEKQKEAKKSADALREALSKIADSIGTPAAPIDQAKQAIDRMNAAIEKIKDPTQKSKAEAVAEGIRKDIEQEVAKGGLPLSSVVTGVTTKATAMADVTEERNSRKTATDLFGPAIGSSERNVDGLKSKISSLHAEIDKLPIPIQTTLIAALNKARKDFADLTPASTAAEIAKVTGEVASLEKQVKKLSQSEAFKGSFKDFLKDTNFSYYKAQLQSVQTQLAAIGVTAKGPVASAIKTYRNELAAAAKSGTLGTDQHREKMKLLIKDIADVGLKSGELNKQQAAALVAGSSSAGDVARGGMGKTGMALNQAAYAIDDFMSATGGIEQKIRAISNNVTQLGFVIGKTKGLLIALGAVIVANIGIAVYRFMSGGKTAEDTTKTLNDALEKQKGSVSELSGAYRELAKSVSLSSEAQKGVENASVLGGVSKSIYDSRQSRLTGVNSSVVAERTTSVAIQRAMGSSGQTTNAGTLIFRNEMLKRSQARERSAEDEARRTPAGRVEDLEAMRYKRAEIVAGMNIDAAQMLEAMGLDPRHNIAFNKLSIELEALEAKIRSTEGVIEDFADGLAMSSVTSAQTIKMRMEAAGSLLASAIESGVPGARTFQNNLDSLSYELSGALNDLAAASEQTGERRGKETSDASDRIDSLFNRAALIIGDTLSYRVKAAFQGVGSKDVLGKMSGNRSFAADSGRLVGASARKDVADAQLGVRTTQLSTASSEENRIRGQGRKRVGDAEQDYANSMRQTYYTGDEKEKKRIEDEIEAARLTVESQRQAANAANQAAEADVVAATAARDKAQADAAAADAADKLAAAAGQAAIDMDQFLGRTRKIGAAGLSASEQTADIRQQMFMRQHTEETFDARNEAEMNLIEDRSRVEIENASLDQRRKSLEMDPRVVDENARIAKAQAQLAEIQAREATTGVAADPNIVRQLRENESSARASRDRVVFEETLVERQMQEVIARDMEDKRRIAEMEQRAPASRAAERARVNQGREDAMGGDERKVLEAARSAENMAAAAGDIAAPLKRTAFVQGYFDNQKKDLLKSGPMGQAEDERFNAAKAGPSRQALNSSDITTSEGAKELSRLLRGEDSSRDVNFAEMKHQSDLLQQIAAGILQATGIAVQF